MYSYEIQNVMIQYDYCLPSTLYMHICDSSKQIDYIKYDDWDNSFYIRTNDNYEWKFTVYNG